MIMHLDGSWKSAPASVFTKVESKPRLEWLDKNTLALIISYRHSVSVCNYYLALHKLCLGPCSTALICIRHLEGRMPYPRRWCWWSPACCRVCTHSWRTQPHCGTLHWCTGWRGIRWYLKHVQAPEVRAKGLIQVDHHHHQWTVTKSMCVFFPWATCLLETKFNTSGNNDTS